MVSKTQLDEALHEQTVTIENKINDSINKIREEIIDRLLLENTKLSTRIKEIEENVVVLEKSMIIINIKEITTSLVFQILLNMITWKISV